MKNKIVKNIGLLALVSASILTTTNVQAEETVNQDEQEYVGEFSKYIKNRDGEITNLREFLLYSLQTRYNLQHNMTYYNDYLNSKDIQIGYKDSGTTTYYKIRLNYIELLKGKDDIKNIETNLQRNMLGEIIEDIMDEIHVGDIINGYTVTDDVLSLYIENDSLLPEVLETLKVYQNGHLLYKKEFNLYDRGDNRVFTETKSFKDVNENYWAYQYIMNLKNYGIVEGSNDYYNPNKPVTREQFAAMLSRTVPFVKNNIERSAFNDINTSWAKRDIHLLYEMGVIKGYSDGSFKPNQPITRQQAVLMIDRFLEAVTDYDVYAENDKVSSPLTDENKISSEAIYSVRSLLNLGIISGDNGQFKPQNNLTRAQMAKILNNILELKSYKD